MLSRLGLLLVLASAAVFAQQSAPDKAPAASSDPYQQTIEAQFGADFKRDSKFAPMIADFDSDGAQDLVLVGIGKNPLGAQNLKNYKVVDPYDSYFGFGDPRVTTKFADFGDGTSHCVLVIHDYQAATPKAKFVIVNLPFERLSQSVTPFKKKTVTAISATEEGGLNAMVFWDGKKYRWEPTDFSTDVHQVDLGAK
jgi:hypothetical protein